MTQKAKLSTQWSAQFYVAAELTRGGYLVSLTLGNARFADLLVVSPRGTQFMIDVKGQSTRNFWLIQRREETKDRFYVLVYLPKGGEAPTYFVVSCEELMARREEYRLRIVESGRNYDDRLGGINWATAFEWENRWDVLPE
jgi:hypothetical protein